MSAPAPWQAPWQATVLTLFPDIDQYLSARPLVSGRRARKLSERISKNRKLLVDH